MFTKNFFRALVLTMIVVAYISMGENIPTIINQNSPSVEYVYLPNQVNTVEAAARVTVPAVVAILIKSTEQTWNGFYPRKPDKDGLYIKGTGSGVLYTSDGYIVTNSHVIKRAAKIVVTLSDGQVFNAKVIGDRPDRDLAILKIDGHNLPFLKFGNSNSLVVGQPILVVGAPYGFKSTVTSGIVSNPNRDITNMDINLGSVTLQMYIQVDAAVNPGNSGGALVDLQGRLIGIACASYGNNGLGFAIHESLVRKTIRSITGQYFVD